MQTIRKAGRNTSGVNIVDVDKGDRVVSIAKCPKEKDDEIENLNIDEFTGPEETTSTTTNVNLLNIDDGDNNNGDDK
jgi:DNA gyrase subunit A